MTQQIDLNALSINELKALAYDCLATINRQQQNLQLIEQAISQKQQAPTEPATQPSTTQPLNPSTTQP